MLDTSKQDMLRTRARELHEAGATLRGKPTVNEDVVGAVKAAILSEFLIELADLYDIIGTMTVSGNATPMDDALRTRIRRNHAMRMASQKGDWDAVSRIANEFTASAAVAGSPADDIAPGGSDSPDGGAS